MNNAVEFRRLVTLRAGLRLEILGGHRKVNHPSCFSILQKQYGYKGTRNQVLAQLNKDIEDIIEKRKEVADVVIAR